MKRYIKSSTNINQNLTNLSDKELREFIQDAEIGTVITYEADYGDWENPDAPYDHLITEFKKVDDDLWTVNLGHDITDMESIDNQNDYELVISLEEECIENNGEDPRINGKITVSYNGKSYTTSVEDD